MKRILVLAGLLVLLLAAGRLAGDASFWRHYLLAVSGAGPDRVAAAMQPRIRLSGAPAALPVGTAESESIAPEALGQAADRARQLGLRALIAHRHGHRVLEVFGAGGRGDALVEGGELAPVVFALALGPLVDARRLQIDAAIAAVREAAGTQGGAGWRNPWSADARSRFSLRAAPQILREDGGASVTQSISERVWQPLRAQDALLWGRDESAMRVDRVIAQLDDWMRVGDLLLQQGNFEGERIASPDWVRALLASDVEGRRHPVWLDSTRAYAGDEPPAARDAFWFDLGPGLRLWLVPRRSLAILVWGGSDEQSRDTELPNLLIRGLSDQAPVISGPSLDQIVPGH